MGEDCRLGQATSAKPPFRSQNGRPLQARRDLRAAVRAAQRRQPAACGEPPEPADVFRVLGGAGRFVVMPLAAASRLQVHGAFVPTLAAHSLPFHVCRFSLTWHQSLRQSVLGAR